jgi:hypothetical protein
MDEAFTMLRDRARTSNRRLSDVAQAFVDGTEALTVLAAGTPPRQRQPGEGKPRQPRPGSRPVS